VVAAHDSFDVVATVEAALRVAFGSEPARASVSFLGLDPIEVLRFESDRVVSYVTLGMSRQPMTASDAPRLADSGPRAELLVQTRADAGQIWRQLAVLAASPAVEGVVYAEGITVDLGQPLAVESRCTGGLVVASALPSIATHRGWVDVLRLLPATSTELAWCRVRGSAELRERWDQQQTDVLDLTRAPVLIT
jgi:hypothetical protein